MINLNAKTNPELFLDYRKGLEYLKTIKDEDYEYPDDIINFHIYSEIRTDKELSCVKSYFATQNLEKTKLIIWSDYDISNQENLKPFADKIDFRVYDPLKEAKGTFLENNNDILMAHDSMYYLKSDLLRLLILYKYGGIWIDMDILLLRDFKPLLDQEWMYQWGSETNYGVDGACATVLSLKKGSILSEMLLKEVLTMPIYTNSTTWGKNLFAKVYQKYEFDVFPSTFFNTEWLISKVDEQLSFELQSKMWFETECPDELLFLDAFAWHWHNSSNKHRVINNNSKFDKLNKIIEKKII